MQLHDILEEHADYVCMNCRKHRKEEKIISEFEGANHYTTWTCDQCNQTQWSRSRTLSSGVKHL